MEAYITATEARTITNSRLDENYLIGCDVTYNMDYITNRIKKAAEGGNNEIRIVSSYLKGTHKTRLKTLSRVMQLGFVVSKHKVNDLGEIMYKIEW